MSEYLALNILIILIPLLFTFEKRLSYYKKFSSFLLSALPVACIFILWDYIATSRGDWAFNNDFIIGLKIFRLPIEEIFFFFTVPFSILFTFEVVKYFVKKKEILFKNFYIVIIIAALLIFTVIFSDRIYTFTVLLFSVVSISSTLLLFPALLHSNIYWWTVGLSYLPFFIINYTLTSLPIVTYNMKSILGLKLKTIPVEDFFYSFSIITLWLLFYHIAEYYRTQKLLKKDEQIN